MYRRITHHVLRGLLLVLWLVPAAWAQRVAVSGQVVGEDGEPIPGVSVLVKGTSTGTITDIEGQYALNVADENTTLVFSFVGYLTREIPLNGQTRIDVSLESDVRALSEIVVVGYGTTKKSDLTGSVETIAPDNLIKKPAASVDQLLQGQAPGLQVITPSGEPGAGATIRIRGVSSLSGSNSPLVVVDGFPWGDAGNLKQINPDDIASIEVLKDASAAAIYGSRGANGVILITTRSGQAGKARISFNSLVSVSTLPSKLDVWRDPVQEAIISNEARQNSGLEPLYTGQNYLGTYYPTIAELRGLDPNRPAWPYRTDWAELVYRNPISQNYTLAADGGNEKTKYSISGNYYNEQGLAIKNGYEKLTGRVNLDQEVHKNVKVGVNLILTHTMRHGGGLSAGRSSIFPVYDTTGAYFRISPLDFGNPIAYANEVLNESKTIDVLGTTYLNWQITPWLQFRTQLSNKYGHSINDWYEPRDATYNGYQFEGFGTIDNWSGNELLNENYFTIDKHLSDQHYLNLVAGFTTQLSSSRGSRLEGHGFVNDNLRNENMNAAQEQIASNWLSRSVLESWIGRASYTYLDRYLVTFTARADGSSKFGANNKWAFFPSAAVAWKIHEEAFAKNLPALSEAKLRVSYGLTGNQGISPYQTLDRLGTGRYYLDGAFQVGYGPGIFDWDGYNKVWSGVPNESLRWETTKQFDIGLNVGLFNQRVTLTADYYYKHTEDLLRRSNITPSSGYDRIWVNDGVIDNQGIELGLNGQILNGPLEWTLGGNFTLNRNKVVSMGENEFVWNGSSIEMLRSPLNAFLIGQPYNAFYGYRTDGIIQTQEEGEAAGLSGDMAQPGEIKYVDLNEDGKVDDNDRTVIGNPNPDFIYTINTSLRYRNFDFSAQLYGVQGNDIFDFQKFSPSRQVQRWTPDNPTDAFPSVSSNRAYYGSDWFVTDGSFLRIQNLTLGYNVPLENVKALSNVRVYLSASNLYTFTKFHTGYDPEVQENGQNWGSYPRPRVFSLGLNFGL
ncbi:TonB-linked outer membrane protein, SusC/RagA family [Catalinimonas alkaloidigena]|uniref:TonB-linked outer membrane protein, SusC/RagA family n=1 Tax=Catalinimonas alkaloidigena TaxID=1075417 RepID=A0A1G8XH42_9BACT|nr:TonB-dependent receptor [Catalinimonas alkaloidigena]SDJ89898.1 TonB-linked outer membrane protein, SusC/RagA family [Catalinimonas alkaloidigena]